MADIHVRRLRKEDAGEIRQIDAAIKKRPSDLDFERIVAEEVGREADASFVAEVGGRVAGFMISYSTSGNFGTDRCAWISMFGVDPKFMGQGIGKMLAQEIFDFHRAQGIEDVFTTVSWDATDILSFFKTVGFKRGRFVHLCRSLS